MQAALRPLIAPRSICVVGASPEPGRVGGRPLDLLGALGYAGEVFGVNPKYQAVQGFPCYSDVESLPKVPELAVIAVAAEQVLPQLRRCHAIGIAASVVFAGGFAETGTPQGIALQAELREFAQTTGMLVAGPNTLGLANLLTSAYSTFNHSFRRWETGPGEGRLAMLTQGGGPAFALYYAVRERDGAFNYVLQTGNEACLGFSAFLRFLAEDAQTDAVLGYIEGLDDIGAFAAAVATMHERGKPLVLYRAGETALGAEISASHTARIVGNPAMYAAAFDQLNVIQARDLEHAGELGYLTRFLGRRMGVRVGILTTSGAFGAVLTDRFVQRGLDVPRLSTDLQEQLRGILPSYATAIANPVDLTGSIVNSDEGFGQSLTLLLGSDEVDMLVVFSIGDIIDSLAPRLIAAAITTLKLIAVVAVGPVSQRAALEAAGVAVFREAARAADTLADMARWQIRSRDWRPQPAAPGPVVKFGAIAAAAAAGRSMLDEREGKSLLAEAGIAGPEEQVVHTVEEALAAGRTIGFPVVLKILSPDIQHKTEVGGVRMGVQELEVAEAFTALWDSVRHTAPGASLAGVLVQRQEQGVAELLVSVLQDEVLGPVLTVGMGGIAAELLGDTVQRLAPVDEAEAAAMLRRLRLFPLLDGYRGRQRADLSAAAAAIARLSALAASARGRIAEIEVNPLILRAGHGGAVAVDCLVRLGKRLPAG